jgi:DNA-binding NtrC family response regulator
MSGQETLTPDAFAFDDDDGGAQALEPVDSTTSATAQSAPAMSERGAAPADAETAAQQAGITATAGEEQGTLQATLDRAASVRIKAALNAAGGNRIEAASALGVDRTTLYRLMKRLSL